MIRTIRPWFDCDRDAALMKMLSAEAEMPFEGAAAAVLRHFAPRRIRNDEYTLFSSCSAMPLFDWAHEACDVPYQYVIKAADRGDLVNLLRELDGLFRKKLLTALSAPKGTRVMIASSPTDAFRMAAVLFALECNGEPMRWLVPSIGEPGTDMPRGMRGHIMRAGEDHGVATLPDNIEVVEISMRKPRGELIGEAEIAETFRRHQQAPGRRPIGVASCGDGTGAAGPLAFQADMIDATQMRVRASRIGEYLKHGYPTVVAGSTFLGGPYRSGALLVPPNTFSASVLQQARAVLADETTLNWKTGSGFSRAFANMLRWMPGLGALEVLAALGSKADIRMAQMTMELRAFLGEYPDFEVIESRPEQHVAFCGRDSGIVPFAVRKGKHGWMSLPDMLGLYERLAEAKVLLGLPMVIGARAALRLSIAAGDISMGTIARKLDRLADVLGKMGYQRKGTGISARSNAAQAARLMGLADGICLQ
ncbi:MAG: hypothetical protein KGH75_04985 [Rhodospirillales bacterium]|nr:hypothetical protein [Rhodospirillales bacterium]